jgi:hypothetical protein
MTRSFSIRPVLPSSLGKSAKCASTHRPLIRTIRHHKFNCWILLDSASTNSKHRTNASDHDDDDDTHSRSEQQYKQTETEQHYARIMLSFFLNSSSFFHFVRMYIISLWIGGLCSLPKNKNNYNTGAPCLCTHGIPQL